MSPQSIPDPPEMTVTTAWTPLRVGDVTLDHRVVLAPLYAAYMLHRLLLTRIRTRARGTKSSLDGRTYIANDLMLQYYVERTTKGGLLISEAA
jgi:hypothetical protein